MTKIFGILFLYCLISSAIGSLDDSGFDLGRGSDETAQTYIVHMRDDMVSSSAVQASVVNSLLGLNADDDSDTVLYNYGELFRGFAAKLTRAQVENLEKMDGILAVQPESTYQLHTTRTPEYLRLDGPGGVWADVSDATHDIVIGVMDSGVWPESPSFSDVGLGPVPARWKGECEDGTAFNTTLCNKKLIGARFFVKGYELSNGPVDEREEFRSPRDDAGHGTHTASTAAGSAVSDASLLGFAWGTASGMAPGARVAIYKVCWSNGCMTSDILAAMDTAVADGVDVMSLSLGGPVVPFDHDGLAMGALSAVRRGIFVSASAGNSGPNPSSVANVAPWITTVGAGTLDRSFPSYAMFGDGTRIEGVSLYSGAPLPNGTMLGLVSGVAASNGNASSRLCLDNTLDPLKVNGKIVVCERGSSARVAKGFVVKQAGGAGMILANSEDEGDELVSDSHIIPAVGVGFSSKATIDNYLNTAGNDAKATIVIKGTVVGVTPSPLVAAFSSRGPNPIAPQILKPDIIGPGVDILAAWTGASAPTGLEADTRRVQFNIISGTSMSCPHISGIAALIKAAHPDWSAAAIRSALMTTAYTRDSAGKTITDVATGVASTPFDLGSGYVDPKSAMDPGLVYDTGIQDYVDFLCTLKYNATQITTITRDNFTTCSSPKLAISGNPGNLNYPSFSVLFKTEGEPRQVIHYNRTVTNVGTGPVTYKVAYTAPAEVGVSVKPKTLFFKNQNEKKSYTVTFVGKNVATTGAVGSLAWTDGVHKVKSPIAFSWM